MNTLARVLAVYLVVVLLDALSGYRLFRDLVRMVVGLFCKLANRSAWERERCTADIFYSKGLWLVISMLMGLAGGYVTLQALRTKKW